MADNCFFQKGFNIRIRAAIITLHLLYILLLTVTFWVFSQQNCMLFDVCFY